MEASTYAWAVIVTFFILYGTIQLRKCFMQLLSSGERTTTNRSSNSSVYTIENDIRNDQDILGCDKKTDDLPTYEEVIAKDKQQNPINHLSSTSEICSTLAGSSTGTSSSNVTASNASIDR